MSESEIGKKAEARIKEWLDKPDIGYSFDRIPDQMTGWFGSKNICDFTLFTSPYMFYIESKATYHDRFDFSMLTPTQYEGLLNKSKIKNVFGIVIVLFASYKRAFILDIQEIEKLKASGKQSLNITKIDKWCCRYSEISTIPSRKSLLEYEGYIEDHISKFVSEAHI